MLGTLIFAVSGAVLVLKLAEWFVKFTNKD